MTHSPSAVPVHLDCDTGIDDALALGYLLRSPDAALVGIGTVSGNTDAAQAASNTLALLALAGRPDVPVAVGEHDFREEGYAGGAPHVHGDDGLGGIAIPRDHGLTPVAGEDAADLLIRLAHEHAGRLRVVAVGPLTNLALALDRDPRLASLVHSVTVMGGAALVPGNVTAVAEANIWHDAPAAARVLEAEWRLRLVPLDVTMQHRLGDEDRAALHAAGDPFTAALADALDSYLDFYVGHFGLRTAALHDPLAAAIALDHVALASAPLVPVTVDTTAGPGRGQTLCDLRGIYRGVHPADARTEVVLALDEPFTPRLLETLLRR